MLNPLSGKILGITERSYRRNRDNNSLKARWRPQITLLRVFLAPASLELPISYPPHQGVSGFEALVLTCLEEWETLGQGRFHFTLASSAALSDIEINWTEKATPGRPYEAGHAHRHVVGDRIDHVTITLLHCPLIDGRLTEHQKINRLKATLLHELGHAFGLEHSPNAKDVMYHQGWQNIHLTHGDQRAFLSLYTR